jgi:hypothetical protein
MVGPSPGGRFLYHFLPLGDYSLDILVPYDCRLVKEDNPGRQVVRSFPVFQGLFEMTTWRISFTVFLSMSKTSLSKPSLEGTKMDETKDDLELSYDNAEITEEDLDTLRDKVLTILDKD